MDITNKEDVYKAAVGLLIECGRKAEFQPNYSGLKLRGGTAPAISASVCPTIIKWAITVVIAKQLLRDVDSFFEQGISPEVTYLDISVDKMTPQQVDLERAFYGSIYY